MVTKNKLNYDQVQTLKLIKKWLSSTIPCGWYTAGLSNTIMDCIVCGHYNSEDIKKLNCIFKIYEKFKNLSYGECKEIHKIFWYSDKNAPIIMAFKPFWKDKQE